ncbi:MAG: aspartate carbamoyltransferase [Verrucomicrobia bacterium]|nr:aspartate carbamoyltransferase [Verrucomicrobiota bacterium]
MGLSKIDWATYQSLSATEKAPHLQTDGRLSHVLIPQQFGRQELDQLGELATTIRRIAKSRDGAEYLASLLAHKRAMLYFSQPSSRTFLSHLTACQVLGLKTGEVRDTATSSEVKGESREDSVRTFSSYFDLIIMRSKERGLAERVAWVLAHSERPVPIINAGSGQDQHPTQAVLDVYTLQRSFEEAGGIDGKRVVFVGDLARGRTVRSLATLLVNYRNVSMVFVAPDAYQIGEDIQTLLRENRVPFSLSADLRETLPDADAIYMTRVQDEWDSEGGISERLDISQYGLRVDDLPLLKPNAVIMHPLPRREELPTGIDADPRAMYWRQMRNGMWIRSALIAHLFGCEQEILAHTPQTDD